MKKINRNILVVDDKYITLRKSYCKNKLQGLYFALHGSRQPCSAFLKFRVHIWFYKRG